MDIVTIGIIIAVLMVVSLILVRMFFKTFFRIISIIWLVVFVAGLVYGLLLYADAMDLKKKCAEMPPALILEDDKAVLAGIVMSAEEPEFIEGLGRFQDSRDTGEFENLTAEYCRIAYIDLSAFDNLSDVKVRDDITLPPESLQKTVAAEDPKDFFVEEAISRGQKNAGEKASELDGLNDDFPSNENFKGAVFGFMLAKAMEEKGPAFLVEASNTGKIRFFPNTIIFKTLKYFPSSLFEKIAGKMEEMGVVEENGAA